MSEGVRNVSVGRRLLQALPKGTPLAAADWQARHRIIVVLLWLHVPAVVAFGVFMGETLAHSLAEASIVAGLAALATLPLPLPLRWERSRRSIRATMGGFGLIAASAILTHLSGGYIEMHFHFFVMVAVMALYQEWPPFLLAITFVALHHGVAGVVDPGSVYNHPDALANPWKWAGIHAFFILGASAAAITTWRYSEQSRMRMEEANQGLARAVSELEATLDATADGLLVVDRNGRITSYNKQFKELWDIPDEILAKRDDELATEHVLDQLEDPETFTAKVQELYARPTMESFDTLTFRDGRIVERLSRPQTLDGRIVGRVWSFRDVTERRRAEEARILAGQRLMDIQRLEEVNAFKTTLLNTASHELNTPLTPLRLELSLLRDGSMGELNERQERSVRVLDRNIDRLAELVTNVLDVARLQSAELRIKREAFDMAHLVRDSLEVFDEAAKQDSIALRYDIEEEGMATTGDTARLSQVLVNFLSNALKFTPAEGRITVMAHRDGSGIQVSVSDNGRGLTPEEQTRLFQPFTQVGDPAKENPTGTGLGLYICKGIIEAHGGEIGVTSEGIGQGTTFWFSLPDAPHGPNGHLQGADEPVASVRDAAVVRAERL